MRDDIREAVQNLKRERIVAAAVDLFYQHGFSHTTLDQVADRTRAAGRDLAGGDRNVVLSTTAIIIILLILILGWLAWRKWKTRTRFYAGWSGMAFRFYMVEA